jgi:hypothetical protein
MFPELENCFEWIEQVRENDFLRYDTSSIPNTYTIRRALLQHLGQRPMVPTWSFDSGDFGEVGEEERSERTVVVRTRLLHARAAPFSNNNTPLLDLFLSTHVSTRVAGDRTWSTLLPACSTWATVKMKYNCREQGLAHSKMPTRATGMNCRFVTFRFSRSVHLTTIKSNTQYDYPA